MRADRLDTALPAGTDPARHARLLKRVHEAAVSGGSPPVRPRPVIEDSWGRMRGHGVDPERGRPSAELRYEQLVTHREASPLAEVVPLISGSLLGAAEDAGHVMLVTDARGCILWRDGSDPMRRLAEGAGLVEGAVWDEAATGTNAIGTALVVGRPVQVYSAEHYVRGLHRLTCACAPVRDPRDGRVLGAIDVTGPAATAHPSTLALVNAVARLAESHLRERHHDNLERLRAVAAPLLAGLREKALVVDENGWTAAAVHTEPVRRVALPRRIPGSSVWLPELGECLLEPLPGGWLVRPGGGEAAPATRVVLDLAGPPEISLSGPSGQWAHRLSVRHAEVLFVLARNPGGRSAAGLSEDLFGSPAHVVTVRAEMSRLRRRLGGILESRPYRFSERVQVELRGTADAFFLPESQAPAVRAARASAAGP
ncbi:GAF domain-containing protein [Nocardiopsis sp. CNT-189]|uniref:GAF domain-containing protein n=1 Tax=Nocardiopsis oceanisediminis TaxID=2816862 RepID=UPI003B2EB789